MEVKEKAEHHEKSIKSSEMPSSTPTLSDREKGKSEGDCQGVSPPVFTGCILPPNLVQRRES